MTDKNWIYSNLNEGLKSERGEALRRNLEKNLPLISSSGGLAGMAGIFSGRHAVVIGAGPSLDRNIRHLKKYRDRLDFIYLAADMALRPLYRAGIVPRFVITCETTPADFFSGIDTSGMHLLAFSCSSPSNLRKWRGRVSFYNWMIEGEPYTFLWDRAGRGLGSVATGSIVTTQAVSIVLGCAVSSLILVGNDMGFYDRFYASGTIGSDRRLIQTGRLATGDSLEIGSARRNRYYEVKREGALYYTNHQFLAAKYWLEDLFSKNPYPVIDCSEPGCSEGKVIKMELYQYFENLEKKRRRGRR